jgi:hypothetical protein
MLRDSFLGKLAECMSEGNWAECTEVLCTRFFFFLNRAYSAQQQLTTYTLQHPVEENFEALKL